MASSRESEGTIERVTCGVRRLHAALWRQGSTVILNEVRRLYIEEGLELKPRRLGRKAGTSRELRTAPTHPNEP